MIDKQLLPEYLYQNMEFCCNTNMQGKKTSISMDISLFEFYGKKTYVVIRRKSVETLKFIR